MEEYFALGLYKKILLTGLYLWMLVTYSFWLTPFKESTKRWFFLCVSGIFWDNNTHCSNQMVMKTKKLWMGLIRLHTKFQHNQCACTHGSHFHACTAVLAINECSNQMVMKTKKLQMGLIRLHIKFQHNWSVHAHMAATLIHAWPFWQLRSAQIKWSWKKSCGWV